MRFYIDSSADKKKAKKLIKELKNDDTLFDKITSNTKAIAKAYNVSLASLLQYDITIYTPPVAPNNGSAVVYCLYKYTSKGKPEFGFTEIYFDLYNENNPPIVYIYKKQEAKNGNCINSLLHSICCYFRWCLTSHPRTK